MLLVSIWLRYFTFSLHEFPKLLGPFTILNIFGVICMFIVGLYDITQTKNTWKFFQKIVTSALCLTIIGIFYFYLNSKVTVTPKTILLLSSILGFGGIALWRYFYNTYLSKNLLQTNVVFAGYTLETEELIKTLEKEPERGYIVQGIIDSTIPTTLSRFNSAPHLAVFKEKTNSPIHLLVIAPEFTSREEFLKELYGYLFKQIQVIELAEFYEQIMERIPPFTFSESWFLTHLKEQQKKIYDRFRILTDYIIALLLGIFFIITFPFIALGIKLTSSGPIFFKQERVGRQEKIFILYKYRTMKALVSDGSAELNGPEFAKHKDPRITVIGKFLRKTRLDELPQFINILKNEMSMIGPRPERSLFVKELVKTMPFYSLRHLIKPGLTGWAQLQNTYYGTIEENLHKLEYDLFYIKNRGPILDISILLRTINTVVRMRGR